MEFRNQCNETNIVISKVYQFYKVTLKTLYNDWFAINFANPSFVMEYLCKLTPVCLLFSLREIVAHKKRKSLFWSLLWKLLSFYFYSYCNQRWFIILANIGTKYPFVKLHGLQWTHVRFITNNSLNQNSYHLYQVNPYMPMCSH